MYEIQFGFRRTVEIELGSLAPIRPLGVGGFRRTIHFSSEQRLIDREDDKSGRENERKTRAE